MVGSLSTPCAGRPSTVPCETISNVLRRVAPVVTDPVSALLGGLLIRLVLVGTVVVGMLLVLRGQYSLAAGLLVPLAIVGYLLVSDAGLLR